jgi:FkbM family methyltransferase
MAGPSITEGKIVHVRRRDVDVRFFVTDPSDLVQSNHALGYFYESKDLLLLKDLVRPGSVILDVGSFIGNHAIFFEKFMFPNEVILIEPNPGVLNHLQVNVRLNGLRHVNESFLGIALGDEVGIGAMFVPDHNPSASYFMPNEKGVIRLLPGDVMFGNKVIDFIKIDAENMEMQVLRGLDRVIARCSPDLYVEVSDDHLPAFKQWCDAKGYCVAAEPVRYHHYANYFIRRDAKS